MIKTIYIITKCNLAFYFFRYKGLIVSDLRLINIFFLPKISVANIPANGDDIGTLNALILEDDLISCKSLIVNML